MFAEGADKWRRRRGSGNYSPLADAVPAAPAPSRAKVQVCAAVAAALVLLVTAAAAAAVHKGGKSLFRTLYYSYDPVLLGRDDSHFPSPRCCTGAACAQPRTGRVAVLTTLRSDDYLPLLRQLHCTLRRSNPQLELALMMVEGELGQEALQWVQAHNITRIAVPPLFFPNHYATRYSKNWIKLHALNLTQYDAVLLIDSDTVVLGPLDPLFSLPAEFAAIPDQPKWLGRWNPRLTGGINGGVLLVRPCPAVLQHMLQLLTAHPKLRFSHGAAEQDFLNWYYRYTGFVLPLEYNVMASDSLRGNLTLGGQAPVVVHFTQDKPFWGPDISKPGHQFLCRQHELA